MSFKRASFIGAGAAIALGAVACSSSASSAIGELEMASQFDAARLARAVDKPADVRICFDASSMYPKLLGAVMNALNGYQFGYAIAPDRIAITVVAHGLANLLLYDDAAWQRYELGQTFGVRDPGGNLVTSNIFAPVGAGFTSTDDPNDQHGSYHRAFIGSLQARGVVFTACNTALYEQAISLSNAGSGKKSAQAIADDLRAHLIPGAILVPSGVATVGLLQYRYHYAYVTEVAD